MGISDTACFNHADEITGANKIIKRELVIPNNKAKSIDVLTAFKPLI